MSRLYILSDSLKGKLKEKLTVYVSAVLVFAVLVCMSLITVLGSKLTEDINETEMTYTLKEPVLPERVYNVSITADGRTIHVDADGTVADALSLAGIEVDDDDLINVGLNEKVCAATNIVINRVECRKTVKVETIAYATKYQEDEDLILGYKEVLVEGKNGEKEVTSLKRYIDGKLVASKILEENVVEPAVDKVVLKGTGVENAGVPASTISQVSQLQCPKDLIIDKNGAPIKYSKVYTGKSCAYSAKPGAYTASGRKACVGYVAVDPALIPYGTELYIVSTDGKYVYGYAVAADTGTALLDGRILVDLFMGSYEESCEWGAKQVNIYVLD